MIFLTGFMGSGKTTVGRKLAALLSRPFVDIDDLVAESGGTTVSDIFCYAGEAAFRFLEKEQLSAIAAKGDAYVVATGGGVPTSPYNRSVMKSCGIIVYLKARFETLQGRVQSGTDRPLWNEYARRLYEERCSTYEEADLVIDTDGKTPDDVAGEICSAIAGRNEPVPVILDSGAYPIYLGKGIFRDITSVIARHTRPEGIFVMVDGNVLRRHRDIITDSLAGTVHHIMEIPPGEGSKSGVFLQKVLEEMFSVRVNRDWLCLAIGGGVTGDLAGFASSIFMRGIPVAHVATTLLAQVDSAIGGKTAINNEFGKNLVGTFHQPLFVVSDVDFLSTLEEGQVKSALAEVIKYGIIMDAGLFGYMENTTTYDYTLIARRCSRNKARIVKADEKEGGLRRILNFGHTLGHAIERASDYRVFHGQAVAMGMMFSAWVSHWLGLLGKNDLKRIHSLIRRERIIPSDIKLPEVDSLAELLFVDKKASGSGIYFVLTPSIGNVTVKKLTDSKILEAYKGFFHGFEKGF